MPRPLSPTARADLLSAASDLLAEGGLDAVTADEVARRSGVAKSTLYRHFESIDELSIAALDQRVGQVEAPDTGTFRGDLRVVITALRDVIEPGRFRYVFASVLARSIDDPEFASVFRRTQEARHAPLRRVIQRGMARGEIDPTIEIDQALYCIQGPLIVRGLLEDAHLTTSDIEAMLDMVVRALAPPP